jgi:hypothetical protein
MAVAALTVFLFPLLVLATGAQAADKVVRVGAIYPLIGPAGSTGAELKDAITLAADIVNGKCDLDLPLAHFGFVIQTGRSVLEGTGKELLDSEIVRKAYLGM